MQRLEKLVRALTVEINGQFPRPWMTDLRNPGNAEVFVVGYNPASAYLASEVDYERHIDALFNRHGESCRALYAELTRESATRGIIEMFVEKLATAGVTAVLETNVVCYSTRKASDLGTPQHFGGKPRGNQIFRALLSEIQPRVIILHGVGVSDEFSRVVEEVPRPPTSAQQFVHSKLSSGTHVFVIPSLALPGYRNWPTKPLSSFCNWAESYLDEVAVRVARSNSQ